MITLCGWACYSVSNCYTEGLDGYAVAPGIPLMLLLHKATIAYSLYLHDNSEAPIIPLSTLPSFCAPVLPAQIFSNSEASDNRLYAPKHAWHLTSLSVGDFQGCPVRPGYFYLTLWKCIAESKRVPSLLGFTGPVLMCESIVVELVCSLHVHSIGATPGRMIGIISSSFQKTKRTWSPLQARFEPCTYLCLHLWRLKTDLERTGYRPMHSHTNTI